MLISKNTIYHKKIDGIYLNNNKIILKDFKKYLSLKKIETALNKSGLSSLMKYNDDDELKNVLLKAVVSEKNNIPYVSIYYITKLEITKYGKQYIKKFLNIQIMDGWNENGLDIKNRNNKYVIFLGYDRKLL